jgi:cation diffusion facilitator CzcD-associated flavoprotein CzcO
VRFDEKNVAVVGTGSSGIQAIPEIAKQAKKLFVLQRTPNYSVPARNRALNPNFHFEFVKKIDFWRTKMMESRHGHPWVAPDREVKKTATKKRLDIMERAWLHGGLSFRESFSDVLVSAESNEIMSEFIRQKILKTVINPETANKLLPKDHPFGTKRPPIDTNYFETFNRENVCLIDL